jgi:hypothetical protein
MYETEITDCQTENFPLNYSPLFLSPCWKLAISRDNFISIFIQYSWMGMLISHKGRVSRYSVFILKKLRLRILHISFYLKIKIQYYSSVSFIRLTLFCSESDFVENMA